MVLVHSKPHLLSAQHQVSPAKAQALRDTLVNMGVEVRLNETFAENQVKKSVYYCLSLVLLICVCLKSANDALVLHAGKSTPNTSWLPQETLDERGLAKTDSFLRLVGFPNVFVAGDIVSGEEEKENRFILF